MIATGSHHVHDKAYGLNMWPKAGSPVSFSASNCPQNLAKNIVGVGFRLLDVTEDCLISQQIASLGTFLSFKFNVA